MSLVCSFPALAEQQVKTISSSYDRFVITFSKILMSEMFMVKITTFCVGNYNITVQFYFQSKLH